MLINWNKVAPLVGAWIEIEPLRDKMSRSLGVAPLVGAWIEIETASGSDTSSVVAPLVGAWIEMRIGKGKKRPCPESLPSWERGLKYY